MGKRTRTEKVLDILDNEVFETLDGCLEYTGYTDALGYARMTWNYESLYVHREVYRACKGFIPLGYVVMHSCDNRSCVNILHLELGTQKDNMKDKNRSQTGKKYGRSEKGK